MKLSSQSFTDGAPIPGEFAFCIPADEGHVCLGGNRNPQLSWAEVPAGTQSFVLICHDPDVPSKGDYHGYDGPCPPWNDEIIHHYVFTLYALDVPRCAVDGRFTGQDVRAAIADHVLAEAKLTGTYTLNPALRG